MPVKIGATPEPTVSIIESVKPKGADSQREDKKPSIAILPFAIVGFTESWEAIGDAIPTELIASLSRLRWLRVIARGSTFRFRGNEPDLDAIRAALGAGYCVSGVVELFGTDVAVIVELMDTDSHELIWSGRFTGRMDDIHEVRGRIIGEVIAAFELHIPQNEANKARQASSEILDAWSEFHIGLQHMYRFNRADNEIAAGHFDRAIKADPGFARAFAARSFTSFQRAFMKYTDDIDRERQDARRFAEQSMELDPLDPFGNYNLARTHWLDGNPDGGLEMLERAVQINPNFAQAHYALAWADAMAGRGERSLEESETAIRLSPLDPLLYAMLGTRGFALIACGDYAGGAEWADRAARSPGAHFLIGLIAVAAHQLNKDEKRARYWLDNVRSRRSDASIEHFFTAFPFSDEKSCAVITEALVEAGPVTPVSVHARPSHAVDRGGNMVC